MVRRREVIVFLAPWRWPESRLWRKTMAWRLWAARQMSKKRGNGKFNVTSGEGQAALRLGKNAFLLNANTQVDFEVEPENRFFRAASVVMGGMHGVFDPGR
jgi:hypothetical protein